MPSFAETISKGRILSFDPGLRGGVADLSMQHQEVHALPPQSGAVFDMVSGLCQKPVEAAIVEAQWSRPGQQDWDLAIQYCAIFLALRQAGIEPVFVTPAAWKAAAWPKGSRVLPYDEVKAKDRTEAMRRQRRLQAKLDSITRATELFPQLAHRFVETGPRGGKTYHDGLAEALLVGYYGPSCKAVVRII